MAINNLLRRFLMLPCLIMLPLFIYAQNNASSENESRNVIARTEDGFLVHQILSLPLLDNILRYEIEIEERQGTAWIPILNIQTRTNSFEVTLKAGEYRYRYTAYNIMNLQEGRSGWQNFRLIPAIPPNIESYQSFYGMYREIRETNNTLAIYGSDFTGETEFALVKITNNYDWTGVSLEKRKDVILPINVEIYEAQATLTFAANNLKRGNYEIFVRNPGGLWMCFGEVKVGYHNNTDITLEFGLSPAYENGNFKFWGNYFRFGWYPVKTKIGNFGLGVHVFFNYDDEKIDTTGTINLLYQYRQNERIQHNIRLGFFPMWAEHETYVDEGNWGYYDYSDYFYVGINLGYSIQYFIWKNMYATAGIDFIFNTSSHSDSNFRVQPAIGFGWQFGRWAEQAEIVEGIKRGEDYSLPVTGRPRTEHLLAIGWSPMVALAGFEIIGFDNYYEEREFLGIFNPLGASLTYAMFPHRWGKNKLGFGFDLAILEHKNRTAEATGDLYKLDILSHFFLQVYYQRILTEDWQIGIRAGFGISNPYDYINNFDGPLGAINFGASAQYFFWKNAFVAANLDINYLGLFRDSYSKNSEKVLLRPGIYIGWQFRRNNPTGLNLPGTGLPFVDSLN